MGMLKTFCLHNPKIQGKQGLKSRKSLYFGSICRAFFPIGQAAYANQTKHDVLSGD